LLRGSSSTRFPRIPPGHFSTNVTTGQKPWKLFVPVIESAQKLTIIDKEYSGDPPASVKDLIDHIDYAVKLIGLDHVGITSDFDGGGGITGWNDASETFNVTLELVRRGYTEEQIGKLWSGNLLRVMDEVQRIASELRKME
jgi:membrane dipeptidase